MLGTATACLGCLNQPSAAGTPAAGSVLEEAYSQEGNQAADKDVGHQDARVGSDGQLVQIQALYCLLAGCHGAEAVGLAAQRGGREGTRGMRTEVREAQLNAMEVLTCVTSAALATPHAMLGAPHPAGH